MKTIEISLQEADSLWEKIRDEIFRLKTKLRKDTDFVEVTHTLISALPNRSNPFEIFDLGFEVGLESLKNLLADQRELEITLYKASSETKIRRLHSEKKESRILRELLNDILAGETAEPPGYCSRNQAIHLYRKDCEYLESKGPGFGNPSRRLTRKTHVDYKGLEDTVTRLEAHEYACDREILSLTSSTKVKVGLTNSTYEMIYGKG